MELTVHAERSDGWWALSVPGVRGLHSQCKRLEQAEEVIKDAASLYFERDADDFAVTVVPYIDGLDIDALRAQTDSMRQALSAAEVAAAKANRAAVKALRDQGLSVRDVAALLGISPQRVSQLAG